MATEDIKKIQSGNLKDYLDMLTKDNHRFFIDQVYRECNISRKTFFNWKYGQCMIPQRYMHVIEKIAKKTIFDWDKLGFEK